ncbi:Cna B-type domain-containing protein [Butyrivibrio proteoclasticus]|uniref:Cna B-type domain-containing protein n=1 Tax=Butyrivibrio proteoclasticus TaxID=43305 RepID=UPI00047A9C71|nr:Cna B-type domain-containing protein [Butyrivibrio proteoclasticus]
MSKFYFRVISIIMSFVLLISGMDLSAFAYDPMEEENNKTAARIIGFDELPENIRNQRLEVGGLESDISFPESLNVTIKKNVEENNGTGSDAASKDSSSTGDDENGKDNETSGTGSEKSNSNNEDNEDVNNNSDNNDVNKNSDNNNNDANKNSENNTNNSNSDNNANEDVNKNTDSSTDEDVNKNSDSSTDEDASKNSENSTNDTNTNADNNTAATITASIVNLFAPLTVYAADNDAEHAQKDSDTTTSEYTINNIVWKIDTLNSTSEKFSSDKEGAVFVYVPVIPKNYRIEASVPTITVTIGDATDESDDASKASSNDKELKPVINDNSEMLLNSAGNYIEKAEGKSFSQAVRVNFSDASLVNSGDKIRLTVYGNIKKETVRKEDNVSSDLIQLFSGEFGLTQLSQNGDGASTAYADCTITGIPAYIMAGTGDVTNGGTGTYQMPSGFYGIQVETISGYTPAKGSGNDFIILSPVKDDNNAEWSTSRITVENKILDLVNPSFSIDWQDNRNFAGMRPYSDGSSIMEDKSSDIAAKIKLFYKEGDSYISVDASSSVLVSRDSVTPFIRSSSFSTWNVSYSKLPKSKSADSEYEWFVRLSDDFLDDGTDKSAYYQAAGYNEDGYLPISESGDSKISMEYTDGVRGSIIWRADSREISIPSMPDANTLFTSAGMKLYQKAGDDPVKEVSGASYQVNWTLTQSGDQIIWEYEITGLSLYTPKGDAIVYYTVMEQNPFVVAGTGSDATSYKFIYDNGEISSETDKCYSGQKIYATVMADAGFSFTKVWYDGNDDASIARRKAAIEKGITLYLWRYPVNKGIGDGAPVTKDARQYTYKLVEADAGDADNNTIVITQDNFATGQSDTFPKYDEMGYRYVYYVTEVSESELYKTLYHNGDSSFDGTSTDKAAENGGQICNVRSTKVAPSVTKVWKSSSVADYVGSESTFVLQKKVDGNWTDTDNEVVLKGFSSGKKKVTGVFGVQDLYDGLGRNYEFRVIEKSVVSGDKTASWISEDWTEDNGKYSAIFELGDYTYQAVSEINVNMTEGSESAEATVTNKLYGTKELTLKKIWDGDWGIGTSEDKTGDVTFEVYRSDKPEVYATIVMKKAIDLDSQTEGQGSFTLSSSDSFVIAKNDTTYDIEGSGSTYTWTTAPIIVPAYTEDGEQYTYTIKESVVTSRTFGKEYYRNISGKKIELTARNYTASDGNKIRFDVNKVWMDEGDLFQRADIKVEFGTYDADGNFTAIADENDKPYVVYLKASNDYTERIWIDKDKANGVSVRESLYNDATGQYDREITKLSFDADQVLTGGYISGLYGSQGSLSKPGYKVQINRDENSFTITNTRVARRAFKFTKVWKDSDNALKLRGDFLRVALFREEGGSEKEIAYIDIPTYRPEDSTTLSSGDALTVLFDNNEEYFPAYDENGQSYVYSIKEYICKGAYTSGEQILTDGAAENEALSREEVKVNATTETTTTGYVVEKFTEDTSYQLLAADEALGRPVSELLIQDDHEYTNMAAGQRAEVPFYLVWNDPAKSSERPDVYFTLYYKVGPDGELKPYTGEYTERWDDVEAGNKYIQKAIFGGLPAADESGRVYSYYVALTLNNAASNYIVDNYEAAFDMGTDGTLSNTDSLEVVPVKGTNYLKVKEGVEKSEYTKENSFAVIGIKDTIKIEGRKLWIDVPEGIIAENLPNAYIYLFRESDYDDSNKVPDISGVTTLEGRKDAYFEKSVSEITSGDGSKSPQKLNDAKAMFVFGTYDESGNPVYVEFPKYDEMGFLYKYSVREIIYNEFEHELPADIMVPSYYDNTADLKNVYKLSSAKNKRDLKVTVQWNVDKSEYQNKDAKATIRLYRVELGSDGDNYNAMKYAENDDNPEDKASSSHAAALFDLGSPDFMSKAELLKEEIVQIPATPGATNIINWLNMPVFAPSGRIYAYYAVEMVDDMPGFKAVLNGNDPDSTAIDGSGKKSLNSKVEKEASYIGVAFANSGIDLAEDSDFNLKEEVFRNTYLTSKVDKITFTKEWNSSFSELIPDISYESDPAKRALKFVVTASAASQAGKDNKDDLSFTEGTDYTVTASVVNDEQGNAVKGKWKYEISFADPVPVYSANGNPYVYKVEEKLNSGFVIANYQRDVYVISANATSGVSSQDQMGTDSNLIINMPGSFKNSLRGSITVSKRWDDYSNDYGMREGLIRFKVDYRVGDNGTWKPYSGSSEDTESYKIYEVDKNSNWKTVLSKLPVAADNDSLAGDKYQYRIRETQIVAINADGTESVIDVPQLASQDADVSQNNIWKQNGTGAEDSGRFFDDVSAGNYKVYNPADVKDITSPAAVKIVNQLDSDNAVTKLDVVKIWDDESDKYGLRQTSITVMIQNSRDGESWTDVASRVITSSAADPADSNKWVSTFENLPKYYGSATTNDKYLYRAVEIKNGSCDTAAVGSDELIRRGGSYSIVHDVNTSDETRYVTTITNTLIRNSASISVKKVWNDQEETHEDVSVALYSANFRGGSASSGIPANTGSLVKLSFAESTQRLTDTASSYTYTGLPKYNKDGNVIIYYVKELTAGSFKTQYLSAYGEWPAFGLSMVDELQHTDSAGFESDYYVTVFNSPYTSASVQKEWDDADNKFGTRPDSIFVKLQRKEAGAEDTDYVDATWADIPENITAKRNINDGNASERVVLTLNAESANNDPSWSETLNLLPAFKRTNSENPVKLDYRFIECDAAGNTYVSHGYSSNAVVAGGSTTITNTLITKDITVIKKWDDDSNLRGKRPSEITVTISGEGAFTDTAITLSGEVAPANISGYSLDAEATVSADGNTWTYTFTGLPKYAYGDGIDESLLAEMTYTVTEDVDASYNGGLVLKNYYTTVYAANGETTTITNTAVDAFVSLKVEKKWDDNSDHFGFRPDDITVIIQRSSDNGTTWEDFGTQVISSRDAAPAGNGDKWIKVFDNLPKYYGNVEDNVTYLYRAVEAKVGEDEVTADATQNPVVNRGGEYIVSYAGRSDSANDLFITEITNTLDFDPDSHRLKIINATNPVQDEEGKDIRGGEVKIYAGGHSVNREDEINEADYVDNGTDYIEEAMSVEFRPDEEKGYTYSDTLTVYWWNDGDDLSEEIAPHAQTISGYLYQDSSTGHKYPYVGRLKSVNGEIQYESIDGADSIEGQKEVDEQYIEAFKAAWSPLLTNEDSPFEVITILQGSVVVTLASNNTQMPIKTLVEVSFVPKKEPGRNGASSNPGNKPGTGDEPGGSDEPKDDGGESGGSSESGSSGASTDDGSSTEDADKTQTGKEVTPNKKGNAVNSTKTSAGNSISGEDAADISEDNKNRKGVRTGDDTPIDELAVIFEYLLLAFVFVFALYCSKRKRKDSSK